MIGIGTACRTLLALASLASLLLAATAQAQAPRSIVAAADPPGSASVARIIEVGSDDIEGAHFSAGSDGPVQLLLRDGSTVTLGETSTLSIDRFVFDQTARTARLTMTAEAGRFRFVGGRASKDTPAVLNTPTATIEIRGGINLIEVAADSGETETIQAFGRSTVATSRSTGEQQRLVKNGFMMRIAAGRPIAIARVDPGRLGALLAALEGPPGAAAAFEPDARQLRDIASNNSGHPPAVAFSAPVSAADALNRVTTTTNRLVASAAQTIGVGSGMGMGSLGGGTPAVLASSRTVASAAAGALGTSGNVGISASFFFSGGGAVDTISLTSACACTLIAISPTTFPLNLPPGTTVFFPGYTGALPPGVTMIGPGVFRR